MAENEEKKEETPPVVVRQPESYSEFLNRHFGKLVLVCCLLFLVRYIAVDGKTLIDNNGLTTGLAILVLVFVAMPNLAFLRKKPTKVSEIQPIDPLEEIPLIKEKFARLGRDIEIIEVTCEPWEGEGAGQPEVYHYIGVERLGNGIEKPFMVSQGALTRFATKFSNKRYIETHTFTSAGVRKRPIEPGPRIQPPPIRASPTEVKVVIPRRLGKEEEEENEEEEEEQ